MITIKIFNDIVIGFITWKPIHMLIKLLINKKNKISDFIKLSRINTVMKTFLADLIACVYFMWLMKVNMGINYEPFV